MDDVVKDEPESNDALKLKFQKVYTDVVHLNLSSVIDYLFEAAVISIDDLEDLQEYSSRGTTDRSRRLMTVLYRTGHPRAFVELRRALSREPAFAWLVAKLDAVAVDERLLTPLQPAAATQTSVSPCHRVPCPQHETTTPDVSIDAGSKRTLNIIFLGETGVGKSTLINALANYIQFASLSDAEEAGGLFPVSVCFKVTDRQTYRRRTVSVGHDGNELHNDDGGSVTQSPTAYCLDLGHLTVNLIDTPGGGSTQGEDQDKQNAQNILTFVSAFEKVDLICVVLKSNETRLTRSFENCLRELLRSLHDSARDNVVFCLTYARASHYGPGETYHLLTAFCNNSQPKLRDAIQLSPDTVYCFENEPVRFLAEVLRDERERSSVAESWRHSTETAAHLLQRAASIAAHSVVDTISLNNARRAIVAVCQPLVETAKCVVDNVHRLKRARDKIAYNPTTSLDNGRVEVMVRQYRFVELPYSATVCKSSRCSSICKGILYERVCHAHCRWSPIVRMCRVFDVATGRCTVCGCDAGEHAWSSCVAHVHYARLELNVDDIERRKNQSMTVMSALVDTSARLTAFLRQNSLGDGIGDVITDGLQKELDVLCSALRGADKQTQRICRELREYIAAYRESVDRVLSAGQRYGPKDIRAIIDELFRLPISGAELRDGVQMVQSCNDDAIKRRMKLFRIDSWMFRQSYSHK